MSDVHILSGPNGRLRMVCHVPIPNGNNSAGVAWSTAVRNWRPGPVTILKDGDGAAGTISAAEKTALESGALYESVVDDFLPDSANTNPERTAYVDRIYNETVSRVQERLGVELKWFGYTREVP